MSMIREDQAQTWLPSDFGAMLDIAVQAKAVAAASATVFGTDKQKVGFPLWVSSPAVAFYDELDDINPADGETEEVTVIPSKTAGLTLLSNELVDDSNPAIADQVAAKLADQIAESLDAAYFANTTAKGPDGLLSAAYTPVSVGAELTNLDAFISGRYAAEAHRAKLSAWLMHPTTAEALSKLKVESGSNLPLLEFVEDGITVAGLPVITSTHVDENTVAWGVDKSQVRYVLRKGSEIKRFDSVVNDGLWIRAISRVGFGFLNEPGVVRLMVGSIEYDLDLGGADGGTFTLSLNGVGPSATIAYGASAATVKSTIVAIDDGIVADDVTVTGSAGEFTITVPGTLTADFTSLTNATDPSVVVAS